MPPTSGPKSDRWLPGLGAFLSHVQRTADSGKEYVEVLIVIILLPGAQDLHLRRGENETSEVRYRRAGAFLAVQ